jgi:hypothetical protein
LEDRQLPSASASVLSDKGVFIGNNDGELLEHSGLSRRSGFTFIDFNVSP